jgi:hypothetical protein
MVHALEPLGVELTAHPELELIGAVVLAGMFIFTRPLRKRFVKSELVADSLFAGMAAAYVFLVLMPEIDDIHAEIGERIYLLVLLAFVLIYGMEHAAHVLPGLRGAKGEETALLWVRSVMLWCYGFLFLLTIPDVVEADLALYLFTLAVGAVAIAFKSHEVSEHYPAVYQRYGRWVIATGPVVGGAVDVSIIEPAGVFVDTLTAFVAGFIMLLAFTGALMDHNRTRFGSFIAGSSVYVAVFVVRSIVTG